MTKTFQKIVFLFLVTGFFFQPHFSYAQFKSLPVEDADFIKEYVNGVQRLTAQKEINDRLKVFQDKWTVGGFNLNEKLEFIRLTNKMLEANFSIFPETWNLADILLTATDAEVFGKIPSRELLEVFDSCLNNCERKASMGFLQIMKGFYESGSVFKTSYASWSFTEPNPKISFRKIKDPNGKVIGVPELIFEQSNLTYLSKVDSTVIHNTSGTFNILNRAWKGKGGDINWAKMKMPEVYCEFNQYHLNLNLSRVEIDTVTFYYKSLLDKPLKGKFIDVNRGFSDVNHTNYPWFQSYEGGVKIASFIPNVRYEGGFSLRGVKKVGSSYWEWVERPKEPEKEKPVVDPADENVNHDFDDYYNLPDEDIYSLKGVEGYEKAPEGMEGAEDQENGGKEPGEKEEAEEEEEGIIDPNMEKMLAGMELVEKKAMLEIVRGDKTLAKLYSNEFTMDLEKLFSKNTEIIIYMEGGDSLYHPNMELLYEVETDKIYVMKNPREKEARTPISSSYHNYNFYFYALKWDRKSDNIEITSVIDKQNTPGAIESKDFFQHSRFHQFKGVLPANPIMLIAKYAWFHKGQPIFAEDVVADQKIPNSLEAFKLALPDLAGSGFIRIKPDGEIVPLPKLDKWSSSSKGDCDYDAIQIISDVNDGRQGTLNLVSNEVELRGVKFFSLSDSNYVRVVPENEKIKVLKNRNLQFGGIMAGGKLNFYGTDSTKFRFEYDNYKVSCDSLDSLRFVLVRNPPPGFTFSPLQMALRNTSIEGVTGAIYINKINNKNGLDRHAEYSIFDSYTNSFIYWQRDTIQNGVYKKNKLYFSIDPFVLDSLETFDERALTFEGEMFSSEIFPRIRQKLAVMEDQTLGMQYITPPDTGLALYGDKGRFKNEIVLDGSGLHGDGTIESNAMVVNSERFDFFFDSVKAVTKDFYLPAGERDGAQFPEIKAATVNYKWLTKKDEVELTSIDGSPIDMFGGKGKFEGKIVITKEGVFGDGTLKLGEVTIESHKLNFKELDLKAEDGVLKIADKSDPTKFHFVASKLHLEYDVKSDKANFVGSSSGEANTQFGMNNYKSSLSKGDWDRTTGQINIESNSNYPKNNYFYSTDPAQDSLNFMASSAKYNINTRQIDIEGVPFIIVADAKISPDTGKVQVKADGFLRKLENTTIEANMTTNYHRMYEASVEVMSRLSYSGLGKYDYIPVDDKKQFINMTAISVDQDTNTIATGTIDEKEKFHLTEKIFFKGNVSLTAKNKFMRFTGSVKIESKNPFFAEAWFEFDREVNPDSVFIPIQENPKDPKGNLLSVGLYFIPQNRIFYSVFMQPIRDKKDLPVVTSSGVLTVDRESGDFSIGQESKLKGEVYKGNVVSYNDELNTITTKGLIPLPTSFEKGTIDMQIAGSWKDDMANKQISTNLIVGLKMSVLPLDALSKLAEAFRVATINAPEVDFHNRLVIESAAEFLDPGPGEEKNTMKFIKGVDNALLSTDIKLAKELPFSVLLSDVDFKFHQNMKSLYANGEFGLLGLGTESVNKKMNVKIEYNLGRVSPNGVRASDTLQVYFEVDEGTWAFFKFSGDVVWTTSSNAQTYNAMITAAIAKRKKADGYRFELATEADKDDFLARFINRYIWQE